MTAGSTTAASPAIAVPRGSDPETSTRPAKGHIGRIVAGCIVGGALAAVALVTGPFAGAPEHVITGSVLLTFAVAWALLALLSDRLTDQPQRWALVPAALLGSAGVTILALSPTGNEAGWVWPPVVALLAVWMVERSRRTLRSRSRVLVIYPLCAALFLSALGGAYETYQESVDGRSHAMPGRLVDVGGHSLHIDCAGAGSPTVVLEPGLGEISTAMALIAPDVARSTRVCVYDRAGRGWSQDVGAPQSGLEVATDLHTLLDRAGEEGPFVLAGHSAGGLYVMDFALLYPSEVAGVALLDSMSPDQYSEIDGWSSFYEMYRRASAVLPSLSRLGIGRMIYGSAYSELPGPARDAARAFQATPRGARSTRDEFSQIRTTMTEAKALTTLGDRPLMVLTAMKGAQGGWDAAQDALAELSTNTVHRTLVDADHTSLVEQQATATESSLAITAVVDAVRSGRPIAVVEGPRPPA
jgi:pimeloyl-ACP methyl ester carboxylesterase